MNNIFDWLYHKQTNNESQGSNVANNNIQTKNTTSMASSVGTNGLSYAKPQTTNTNDTKTSVDVSQDKTQNNNFFSQLVGLVKEQFKNNQFTNENYNQEVKDKFNSIRAKQLSDKKEEEINNTLGGKDANNIFQYKDQEGNLYGFYDAKQTLEDFTSNIKNSENIIKALDDNIQSQYDSNTITRDSYNNYLTLRDKEYNNLNNLINDANSYYEKLNNSTVEFVDHDIEIESLKNRNSEINKVLEEFDNKYSEEEMGIQMENQETLNWVNKLYEEEKANNERIAQLEEYKLLQNDVVETNYYKKLQEYGTQEEIANYNEYLANEKNAWRNKKNFFDGAFGELMGASNMVVSAAYNMAGGFSQAIDFQIAKFDAQQPYIEQRNELIDKLNNGEITYNDYLNQISDIEKGLTITNDQVYNENSIGNRLVANAQKYNEYAMAGREGVDKFIMEAWGSSVPFLLSYLVAQPFAAATGAILGVDASTVAGAKTMANITKNFALSGMAITEYGNQVNDILSMQNEDGTYKYSVDVANLNALLHGATTFLVEQIGADAFADAITGEVGQYWFQRSISDLAKYGSRYLGQSMINGALSEGAEEGIEKFVNLVVDSQTLGTIDSNNVGDYLNQLLGQWWEDGDIIHTLLVAGVSGGFTNLVGANQRIVDVQTKEDFNRLNSFAKKVNVELTNKVNSEGISLLDKARIVEEQEAFNTIVDQALKGYNDKNVSSSFATITSNKNYDFEAIESIEGAIKESLGPDITKQIDQEVETKSLLDAEIYEFNTLIDRTLINNGIYYGVVGNEERNILDEQGAYVEDTKFYALGKDAREQMVEAAKIINEMGVNDYSFAILRSKKDGQIIDGTNVNGKIIINPICIKGDLSTYVHEFYHRLENKGLSSIVEKEVVDTLKEDFKNQYETLSEEEKSNFKDANDFVEKMYEFLIQNKINEYKQGNINLNRQAAISEVITEQIQNKLGNKNFIDSLIKSNESMAYRLYSSIKANLSGDSWKKIANEYEKAFRNLITNGQIDIRSDLAYSIVGKELENNTKDAYVEDTRTPEIKEAIDKKEMDIVMDIMGLNDLLEQMQNDPNNQASLNKTIDEMSQNIAKPKEVKGAKEGETLIDSEFKNEKQLKPTNEVIKKLAKDYTNKGKYIWDISRKVKDDNIYTLYNQYLNSSRQATYMMNKQGGFNEILNEIPKDLQEDFSYMVYHGVNIDAAKYGKNVFSDFTSEQSQQIFDQYMLEHPSWKSTYEKVLAYENNLTYMLLDNGMINRPTYDKWMEMYPHYVHVSRILEQEESDLQKPKVNSSNKAIKGRTGGKQDIKPLGIAVDEHTLNVFRSINMNEFAIEYSNVAGTKKTNWKDISIDQITGGDLPQSSISLNAMLKAADKNTPATLIYYNNGEMNLMEIPNELYDVFQTKREDNVLTNSLQYMNNIRRNLLTGWDPLFMVTNPFKDVQDVLYKSEHPFATYTKMPKAMLGLLLYGSKTNSNNVNLNNLSYLANSWHSLGGGLNGIVEVNSKSKLYNNTIGKIERINNYIESVPRFAEFLASIDKGRTMTQAMYDSDKVTTNFKMGGEKTKFLDRNGATFLNASVEGLTELVQAYERTYDKNGVKGVIGKMALATFVYNVPLMLLNHLVWGDDDDYEDLSDYIKDNYYIVGKTQDGRFIRIPKGRIAAAYQSVLQSIWDNGVELTSDDGAKEKAVNMWENSLDGIKGVVDNIGVNNPLTNNIASPLINAAMNRTWYGEDIVSDSLAKKDNALQYDYTTDEISKWIGENLNLSPKKINYILDQYSGGVGDVVLPMFTPKSETGLDDGTIGGKVASALLSPAVDKFSSDYVFKNQNVSDIYNLKDELTKKASKENANDEIKLSSNYINFITSQMNKLYGERRDIFNDSTLNDNEKYRQARMVQEQINALAKEGLATYDQLDIVGQYSEVNGYGFLKQDDGSWKKVDNDVNSELDSLGMNTSQKSEYFNMKDTFTSNNRINTLQGYYQYLEEIQNSNYSETMKNTKLADVNSKIVSLKEKMSDSEIAQANGDYDNKAANFETLLNSSLSSEQKNYTYNKYFDSNLNGYIDELDASDEDKMYIKYLASTQTSDKDANGKTIEHSKAKKVAQVYEEYGVLDQVLNYISEYDIEPSVFGLNKTVYTNLKKGYSIGNSGTSTKTSTKYFNEDGTLTASGLKKIASLLNSSSKSSDVSSIVKEFVNKAKQTYDIPTTYEDVKSQFEKKYGKMI